MPKKDPQKSVQYTRLSQATKKSYRLMFQCLRQNDFNAKKSIQAFRRLVYKKYGVKRSYDYCDRLLNSVRKSFHDYGFLYSAQNQLFATTEWMISQAKKTAEHTGDINELMDALKFLSEIVGFTKNDVNINIDQSNQGVILDADTIVGNIRDGFETIGPILERFGELGQISGKKSPTFFHPKPEAAAFFDVTPEGNMATGGK